MIVSWLPSPGSNASVHVAAPLPGASYALPSGKPPSVVVNVTLPVGSWGEPLVGATDAMHWNVLTGVPGMKALQVRTVGRGVADLPVVVALVVVALVVVALVVVVVGDRVVEPCDTLKVASAL